MKLTDYPQAIAEKQHKILAQDQTIRKAQAAINQLEIQIEKAFAFGDFRNDSQRKAARAELLQDQDYQTALAQLQAEQDHRTLLQIELQRVQNQFSVAKLELRCAIARQEAISA
jgi:hypothetical protein